MKIRTILLSAALSVTGCVSNNVGPPDLPKRFEADGITVYRLNTNSEFRHLESIVIAKTTTGLEGAYEKRARSWRYFHVDPETWQDLEQTMMQCRFDKMSPTAPPYALGGVCYSIERRKHGQSRSVFRINPDFQPGEKDFMSLVRTIRAIGEGELGGLQ